MTTLTSSAAPAPEPAVDHPRVVRGLLNVAHALDHLFLLIFAAAVSIIALDMGLAQWQDLMPYGAGAFFMFGLGSLPAGRLGDLWGRRSMMLVFFFGIGAASILTAFAQTPWQLAACLTLIGVFASIYHPVGIPMLLERSSNPGATIGFNGLAGNLGVAVAALLTGFLIQWQGWRAAFVVPGLVALLCGWLFARACPQEGSKPSQRKGGAKVSLPRAPVDAGHGGHDGSGRHQQCVVQFHNQWQRPLAGRALCGRDGRPGRFGPVAGLGLRRGFGGPSGGGAPHQPIPT